MLIASLFLAYFASWMFFGVTGKEVIPLLTGDIDRLSKKDIAILLFIAIPPILFSLFISHILET